MQHLVTRRGICVLVWVCTHPAVATMSKQGNWATFEAKHSILRRCRWHRVLIMPYLLQICSPFFLTVQALPIFNTDQPSTLLSQTFSYTVASMRRCVMLDRSWPWQSRRSYLHGKHAWQFKQNEGKKCCQEEQNQPVCARATWVVGSTLALSYTELVLRRHEL